MIILWSFAFIFPSLPFVVRIMKMKKYLMVLVLLALSHVASSDETLKPELKIHYSSSGLTVITVESNRLECTWHSLRKDLKAVRANLESFDKHQSSISLVQSEIDELLHWARAAIEAKVTEEQKESRRGYSTVLSVTIDGKAYSPNYETIKAFKKIVSKIIRKRRKEGF